MLSLTRRGRRSSRSLALPDSTVTMCSSWRPRKNSMSRNGFPLTCSAFSQKLLVGLRTQNVHGDLCDSLTSEWAEADHLGPRLLQLILGALHRGRPWFGRNAITQPTGKEASRCGSCRIATAQPSPAQWRSSRQMSKGSRSAASSIKAWMS